MKLNFGCGKDIKENYQNVDIENFDFNVFPYPYKNNVFNEILCKQVLQLLDYPEKVLYELWRITKDKGIIDIYVPYFHNKGAHNDINTRYYFNENSFKFLINHPAGKQKRKLFDLELLYIEPTWIFKWIPKWFLNFLDLFLAGIYQDIHIKLKIIKEKVYK